MMDRTRSFTVIFFIVLLLLSAAGTSLTVNGRAADKKYNIFKDIEIVNITHPDVIIKSKANFKIRVTLKNHKSWPCKATVYVFLKSPGHFFENKQIYVGREYTVVAAGRRKEIKIDCRTPNWDWRKQLLKKRRVTDDDHLFYDGSLGVKVVQGWRRLRRPLVDRLFDGEFFMEWKRVTLIEPVVYTPQFYPLSLEWTDIPNETQPGGKFTVSINASYTLTKDKCETSIPDTPIPMCAVVYISPGFVIPGEFRIMRDPYYIVGFRIDNISKHSYLNCTINCTFPHENLQVGNYYGVKIILFNYFPVIGNTNRLGKRIIWLDEHVITPPEEYEKYPAAVKKFWDSLGRNVTFCHPGSKRWTFGVRPRDRGKIFYSDKSYMVTCAEDVVAKAGKEAGGLMIQLYLGLLSLVGFGLIGYWAVRKYGFQ